MVHLIASNAKESHKLHELSKSFIDQEEVSSKVKKHKKHNHIKVCEYCGKGYKGLIGLGIHKSKCGKRMVVTGTGASEVFVSNSSSN